MSMEGVRQDFVVLEKPTGYPRTPSLSPSGGAGVRRTGLRRTEAASSSQVGEGELRLELEVAGMKVEPAAYGAELVLLNSGRKIAYSRLRVTDARGKELPARMEVMGSVGDSPDGITVTTEKEIEACLSSGINGVPLGESSSGTGGSRGSPVPPRDTASDPRLAVLVDDTEAVYPVRIDPTFSDANWISMGGLPGANGIVRAAVVDGSGNLYIGGNFTAVGDTIGNHIAKWNGSSWSALGSGIAGRVVALAVSGSDLYAGGQFHDGGREGLSLRCKGLSGSAHDFHPSLRQ